MTTLKSTAIRLVIMGAGLCLACARGADADDPVAPDALFEQLARYELASSPVPLEHLRIRIRDSYGKPAQREELENRMIEILANTKSTVEGRRFICQQLAVVGTDRSIPVLEKLLGDAELGSHACYALRGIESPAAGVALRRVLHDVAPHVRLDIIQALAQRPENESVPCLVGLLTSGDKAIVVAAATALGAFGNTRAAEALWNVKATAGISGALLEHCRLECAQSLGRSGKTEAALSAYRKLYAGEVSQPVRRGAMLGIIRLGGDEGVKLLLDVLQGNDAGMRLTVISNGLRLLGDRSEGVVDRVMALLPKVPSDEQVVWVSELVVQCGSAMTSHLRGLSRHTSADLRVVALRGLVQLGDETAVPALVEALGGGDAERDLALSGLGKMTGAHVGKAIENALAQAEPPLQVQLIGVLRDRGEENAVPALVGLLEHEDEKVAAAAFQAVGDLAGVSLLPGLLDRLFALKNAGVADRSGVRAVLSIARRHDAEGALLAELRRRFMGRIGVAACCRILTIASALPDARSVAMLEEAVGSGDSSVRETALRGLANHSSVAALPALQRIVEKPDSDKYRILAMRGMVRFLQGKSELDPKQRIGYCELLVNKAKSVEDWNLVLSGLANLPPRAALRLMLPHTEGDSQGRELELAVDKAISSIKPVALFDGKTFEGWDGNLDLFRVEDGAVVGGSLEAPVPRNEYLCTTKRYGNFELRLKFKILGKNTNAGIQIRSERVPNSNEMIGYQADLGQTWWGCLYDERRHKCLVKIASEVQTRLIKTNQWNDYVIRCHGRRVQLWVNGEKTVDYTEPDTSIPQVGVIGLQIHKGPPAEAWYKDISIIELP